MKRKRRGKDDDDIEEEVRNVALSLIEAAQAVKPGTPEFNACIRAATRLNALFAKNESKV